ncbi:FkbM family methyltransferase [Rhodoplanes roseus]|uniref:Methyltransferase FkbM domain-containing protein n=1 Tax=Rhodoplanes roseus TaxID=29409 RepID=A0A327KF92_9BRAD|nr:FkbM family methyltransferase [Rhodoplanes roseus]RAI37450.1 hypothetical protein CH341_29625 [Rhodoplanes roseus]
MSFHDLPKASWLDLVRYVDSTLASERYADPRRLSRFGRKVYSQCDEDGLLARIFELIGTTDQSFLEFGVGDGRECNSVWLLHQGWRGVWLEADPSDVRRMQTTHEHWLRSGALRIVQARVSAETIDRVIAEAGLPAEIDLLSIDIDYNDYWVWKAITRTSPRVVCIEYNATWPPPASIVVPYDPTRSWSGDNHFGASLAALAGLGAQKGYRLVGCSLSGVNAFFVRADLCGDRFVAPGCAQTHYEPARYFLTELPSGHPAGIGETLQV